MSRFLLAVLVLLLCGGMGSAEKTMVNPKDGAVMVWVPEGLFTMGTSKADAAVVLKAHSEVKPGWLADESPVRKVYLDGYWIYKYEVTVAQFRKYCEAVGYKYDWETNKPEWGWHDDHPMVKISWGDAAGYAQWAGAALPTEAQWEKAARGTDGRLYPWGDKWDKSKCVNKERGDKSTRPVGSVPAGVSPYGVMDMAGNVWEWCADWYGEGYYKSATSTNPMGPTSGACRIIRGGSWYVGGNAARTALRNYNEPTAWWNTYGLGFRCVVKP